jgi:hypothetical protein
MLSWWSRFLRRTGFHFGGKRSGRLPVRVQVPEAGDNLRGSLKYSEITAPLRARMAA